MKSPAASPTATEKSTTSFDPEVALAIGTTLRQYRQAADVAQDVMPILSQVERGFYGRLERGEKVPTVTVLLRIAKALGTTGAELIGEIERKLPPDWRPDIERGAVKGEALTGAVQRAASQRAAAARRAAERKVAAAESTGAPELLTQKNLTVQQKKVGRHVR